MGCWLDWSQEQRREGQGEEVMLIREAIGQVLREQRVESSMTLRQMSKISKISISHISDVERGIKEGSSEVLFDMCYALGISVEDLLMGAVDAIQTTSRN